MQVINKPIGTVKDLKDEGITIDYVFFSWDETRRRTLKVTSESGIEIGLRLNSEAQSRGLNDGDVLTIINNRALVVKVRESEVISIPLNSIAGAAKVAYEIGNRHAPSFYSDNKKELYTPYVKQMEELLEKLGVEYTTKNLALKNKNSLSAVTSDHSHSHFEDEYRIVKDFD